EFGELLAQSLLALLKRLCSLHVGRNHMELVERNRLKGFHRAVEASNGSFIELEHVGLDLDLRKSPRLALIERNEVKCLPELDAMSPLSGIGRQLLHHVAVVLQIGDLHLNVAASLRNVGPRASHG